LASKKALGAATAPHFVMSRGVIEKVKGRSTPPTKLRKSFFEGPKGEKRDDESSTDISALGLRAGNQKKERLVKKSSVKTQLPFNVSRYRSRKTSSSPKEGKLTR